MSEFLAEASVLVRANTDAFRAKLLADVASAVKEAEALARVQIVPVGGGVAAKKIAADVAASSQLVTVALGEEAEAARVSGATEQQLAARRATASAAATSYAKVERALVAARLQGVTVVDGLIVGEAGLAEATAAGAAARQFLTAAELQGIKAEQLLEITTIKQAVAMGEAAAATRAKALADEQAAAAAGHHAVAMRNVGRGSVTAALAAIGLRGATLTANAAFIGGAAAAIGFGKAIQSSLKFETSLNVFAATVGATGEQMDKVAEQARALGRDITLPSVNAQDAADAMSELAKAGLSVEDSISGARGVLQLATAAAIDNATATQIAASALNAFGLAGVEAVHVADVLANAANQSQGSIADVGLSLQQAAAVSRQVGVSFEDTVALLTLLARNGIRGSDAGTSLRVAFTKLINPTNKAKEILKQLNIELRDAQGNIRPEVFSDFAQAQRSLSRTQQDANAGIVFGTDALRAYSIAAREGTNGLNEVRDALQEQGTAAELAGARTKGLAGSTENLKNQFATLGLSIGDAAKGPLKEFVDIIADGIENLNTFNSWLERVTGQSDETKQSFAELAAEAAKINFAVQARKGEAGPGLLEEQERLNKALEDSLGPGIAATRMIEYYRDAIHGAALEVEGLRNRIDESADRFARTPVPVAPKGPPAIGPTAKSERAIGLAQAAGDLQETARLQKIALDRAKKAFADSKGNIKQRTALFEKVTQAEIALATTQRQISENAAQQAKQAAADAKTARTKADQAILDSFTGRQTRIDLAQIRADNTETLKDDIAVKNLIIAVGKQEIATIKKTISDMKTRNAEIASRVKEIATARLERERLIKEAANAATEKRRTAADLFTDLLGKQITLAGLREDRGAELAAINRAIADARKRVRDYKKLGTLQIDEKIALEELINRRDDLLNTAKEGQRGTTAFDLLKQFADTFRDVGGNLIGANQPFAGPTGFTADIAQFLVRRPGAQTTKPTAATAAAAKTPIELNDDRLVRSMDRLADVIERSSGNRTTGSSATDVVGQRWTAIGAFWEERQTRRALEANVG